MIIDKSNLNPKTVVDTSTDSTIDVKEKVEDNPIVNVYEAVKRILSKLKVDPDDPSSEKLFRAIMVDTDQFERIVRGKENLEYAISFPAVFIRFVNVRFLVQQQRIGEGRATMRIRFILNNLNNQDEDMETKGFEIFQRINDAIQDGKSTEEALNERCNLTYFDMPEAMNNGLQPYWIDYEIWFRTSSSFQYRNYVEKYIVMAPFTNHSDAPEHDTEKHGDHKVSYDDVSKMTEYDENGLPKEKVETSTTSDTDTTIKLS